MVTLLILQHRVGGGGGGGGGSAFVLTDNELYCTGIDCPGLTQCYNLDFTVLFVRETTLHLAFLSGLQSFKKLFLFQKKKKM